MSLKSFRLSLLFFALITSGCILTAEALGLLQIKNRDFFVMVFGGTSAGLGFSAAKKAKEDPSTLISSDPLDFEENPEAKTVLQNNKKTNEEVEEVYEDVQIYSCTGDDCQTISQQTLVAKPQIKKKK